MKFWKWFEDYAQPKLGIRADSSRLIFEYLDKLKCPVTIVETGCVRREPNDDCWYGDGCSTILFDKYVNDKGGRVYSVDINPTATEMARSLVSKKAHIHTGDSIRWLASLKLKRVDLLYLDSFDLDVLRPLASEVHHINELKAAMRLISPKTLVVVDDSPITYSDFNAIEVTGKGGLVAKYACENGADMMFSKYQTGWTGMEKKDHPRETPLTDAQLKEMIERARNHYEGRRDIAADNLYRQILRNTGQLHSGVARVARGEACLFYARAAVSQQQLGVALDWYRRALDADPRATDYRLEMAVKCYRPMGIYKLGQQQAAAATRIEPGDPHTWRTLGGFEHEIGNGAKSIAAYEMALSLAPADPDVILDRITIALDTADYDKVREMAARLKGTDHEADGVHACAVAASREGRHEDAIALFDKAMADPKIGQLPILHWNKSHSLHSLGRYKEGWKEHEWRIMEKNNPALNMPLLRFNRPLWKGEPSPAKIHVHTEAGAGDNLCCARYLNVLSDRGYEVRYETEKSMLGLMQRSFPQVKVGMKAPDYPGCIGVPVDFDYHQPIGGLPHVLETEIDTVPWDGPYLKPDPVLVAKYRAMLPKGRKYIGLCWSSGIRLEQGLWLKTYGKMKSMKLKDMLPLVEAFPDYVFVSLQVGPERDEIEQHYGMIDVLSEYPTWDDTAALVQCLDTTITVDTGVSHLVGGMGKPVMLAMHRNGSWHYMADRPGPWRTKSPWYPNTTIYRQTRDWQWGDVIEKIADDLKRPRNKIHLVA